jgi:hypothetical protein
MIKASVEDWSFLLDSLIFILPGFCHIIIAGKLPSRGEIKMQSDIFSLENKVALITGSGRDIGKGIALCMAEAGADIVVTARTVEQIE